MLVGNLCLFVFYLNSFVPSSVLVKHIHHFYHSSIKTCNIQVVCISDSKLALISFRSRQLAGFAVKSREVTVNQKDLHLTVTTVKEERRVTSLGSLALLNQQGAPAVDFSHNYMHHYSLMQGQFIKLQPLSDLISHCLSSLNVLKIFLLLKSEFKDTK